MIKYINLGPDTRLNEIVMVGSHDAGITSGGQNAQTQDLDIGGQARAGVRFFDLRIAAFKTDNVSYGAKQVEMKAFHADGMLHKKEDKTRSMVGFSGRGEVQRSKLRAGAEGLGLRGMLIDAYEFVTSADYSSEFLILKFDKCTNWALIADLCRAVLGTALYTGGGNINTKKLSELAGKVVVAFMPEGYSKLSVQERVGVTPIKNLYKPPTNYDTNFAGLQYWGAGGTNAMNGKSQNSKMLENVSTQSKIMAKALTGVQKKKRLQMFRSVEYQNATVNPNAMGMMYWTSTGLRESIRERNDLMWSQQNRTGLSAMWLQTFTQFADYLQDTLPPNIDPTAYGSGGALKMFMPNIVMIDFADDIKCRYIYGLNDVAGVQLIRATKAIQESRGI